MVSTPSYDILILDQAHTQFKECYDIRVQVFANEQGFPLETELDDLDPIATHVLIRVTSAESSIPVGTARISYTPDEFGHYRIGRLAVMKEYRKYRLGSKIMLALEEWAIRDAPTRLNGSDELRIALHSQIPAQPFYAKLGYLPEGDIFDEEGAPHQNMVKTIRFRDC